MAKGSFRDGIRASGPSRWDFFGGGPLDAIGDAIGDVVDWTVENWDCVEPVAYFVSDLGGAAADRAVKAGVWLEPEASNFKEAAGTITLP